MKTIYNYLYYYLYDLGVKLKNKHARESAILYLSVIIVLLTSPFLYSGIYHLFKSIPFIIVGTVGLLYAFAIVQINRKYFENKTRINHIRNQFKNKPPSQRIIGYTIVIILLIISFILFLFFLSLM